MTPLRLYCASTGRLDAPAVVLLHSLGTDHSLWNALVHALERDHRVLALDLRGHGKSPAPRGPFTLADLALDVIATLDAAGLSRADLVGISLGGQVALWLACHRPEQVNRLVLANTAARIGTPLLWLDRIWAVRELGMGALCEAVLSRWTSPTFAARDPAAAARLAATFRSTDADAYAACCELLATTDLWPEVANVSAPTLIIAGGRDVATPVADSTWLHAAIRGSSLRMLDEAAHLSNLDQPDAFTACLRDFLEAQGS